MNRPMTLAIYQAGAILLGCLLIGGIILLAGGTPLSVLASLGWGAVGTGDRIGRVLATLAPLLLCTSGLMFTFTAGLYNIGIEGQMMMGAIAATGVMRLTQNHLPPTWVIGLALIAGTIGGMGWGLLAGGLNVYSRINEIFSGLGLNFVADGLALYLIFGPWQRQGVASMSGTEPFPASLWLPTIGPTDVSPIALGLGLLAVGVTGIGLRGSHFGLQLRAVGQNRQAAYVLGVPAVRQLLSAFAIAGGGAGLAGALQVLVIFHRLIPNISSNLGFLAFLIGLLIGQNLWLLLPVALFFSALNVGSLQLPLTLNLESSLAGVIQGTLVLTVLLGRGWADLSDSS